MRCVTAPRGPHGPTQMPSGTVSPTAGRLVQSPGELGLMAAEESGAKGKETQWLHFTLVPTALSLLIWFLVPRTCPLCCPPRQCLTPGRAN